MPITAAQKERRQTHLGSSDCAAMLGLDPYRSPYDLWLDKTGKLEEWEGNQATEAGSFFEDAVLKYAESELGSLKRNQYRSAKDQGIPIGSNIDAILSATGDPVEAKTAGLFGPLHEHWGEAGTDEVPDRVVIQAHAHMICTGREICHVPVFIGGRGFVMFQVKLDSVIRDVISETAAKFWLDYVETDTPPTDGSLPHASVIKRIRREPETVVDVDDALVIDWQAAKQTVKEAEAVADERERALLAALGQAEGGLCSSGTVTYLQQTRNGIDQKRLKAERPEICEIYAKPSVFRVLRFRKG